MGMTQNLNFIYLFFTSLPKVFLQMACIWIKSYLLLWWLCYSY